jgi:hypothetical protein
MRGEEMSKKRSPISKPIALNIPAGTSPLASGDYILKELERRQVYVSANTSATITLMSAQAAQENKTISKFELQLGADWMGIKFKYSRQNEKSK